MERRDFLRLGAVAGAGAAAGVTGCAGARESLLQANLPITTTEMEGFLSRLDASMLAIDLRSPLAAFSGLLPSPNGRENDPDYAKGVATLRKAMRSLLLVGSFADLPEEGRAYPGMQDRIWGSMAEMDEAMQATTDMFQNLTPTERADIGRALRDDPDLGMQILESLDAESAQAGVPTSRRLHLRAIALEATARLKQSSPLLIDEYLGKVQKISARHGSNEELERQLAARMGEQAFFSMRERTHSDAARWHASEDDGSAVEGTLSPVPLPTPLLEPDERRAAKWDENKEQEPKVPYEPSRERAHVVGNRLLTAGGVLLGLGVVVGVGSYIAVTTNTSGSLSPWVFGVTVGALMVVAGLICLIIGLVKRLR